MIRARRARRPRRARAAFGLAAASAALLALSGCSTLGPGGVFGSSNAGAGASESHVGEPTLVEPGVLTVATEGTRPPFSFHDATTGGLVGYDVEVATAVAEKLGLQIRLRESPAADIFSDLDAGEVDLIADQVPIDGERQADYLFSQPYTVSPGVVVVRDDDTPISGVATLSGKTVAQVPGSPWYLIAAQSGATIHDVGSWAEAVALVQQGAVDATIDDELTYLDDVTSDGLSGLKVAGATETPTLRALVFAKSNGDLVKSVGTALADLSADGTLATLGEKYFGRDVSK